MKENEELSTFYQKDTMSLTFLLKVILVGAGAGAHFLVGAGAHFGVWVEKKLVK